MCKAIFNFDKIKIKYRINEVSLPLILKINSLLALYDIISIPTGQIQSRVLTCDKRPSHLGFMWS